MFIVSTDDPYNPTHYFLHTVGIDELIRLYRFECTISENDELVDCILSAPDEDNYQTACFVFTTHIARKLHTYHEYFIIAPIPFFN
jgi:hypothetical protein